MEQSKDLSVTESCSLLVLFFFIIFSNVLLEFLPISLSYRLKFFLLSSSQSNDLSQLYNALTFLVLLIYNVTFKGFPYFFPFSQDVILILLTLMRFSLSLSFKVFLCVLIAELCKCLVMLLSLKAC